MHRRNTKYVFEHKQRQIDRTPLLIDGEEKVSVTGRRTWKWFEGKTFVVSERHRIGSQVCKFDFFSVKIYLEVVAV